MMLSFGLEIHAVVSKAGDYAPRRSRSILPQLRLVTSALSSAGLSAKPWVPRSTRDDPHFAVWNVMTDPTIDELTAQESDSASNVHRFGVTLISPMFDSTSGWHVEVEKALHAIARAMVWKAKRSASLHVHVGRGGEKKFSLEEVKRIAMLVVRFEEAIDRLYMGRKILKNDSVLSNRQNERLKNMSLTEIFNAIQAASDIVGVLKLVNYVTPTEGVAYDGYEKSFKVYFASLIEHNTIEFRQREGTVSSRSVIAWTKFVMAFVDFALNSTLEAVTAEGNSLDALTAIIPVPV